MSQKKQLKLGAFLPDAGHHIYAHITLASALGLETRLPELQWRQNYPKLTRWYDEFSERPSLQVTKPEI